MKLLSRLVFLLILGLFGCDPDIEISPIDDEVAEQIEQSNDMMLPIELFLAGTYPCDIKNVDIEPSGYTIYFDGSDCSSSVKQFGEIHITKVNGKEWKEEGAILEVRYLNFSAKKDPQKTDSLKRTVKETTLNGVETMINISGGDINEFFSGKTSRLKRRILSTNLSVEYNENLNGRRFYNKNLIKEFINEGGVAKQVSSADTTVNDLINVTEWGTNGYDDEFFTTITKPIVKTFCGQRWILTSGEKVRYGKRSPRTNIYGVNDDGNLQENCNAYGFLVSWTNNQGEAKRRIYRY